MKKHLMILGDVRVGDCFHVGTYLNKLKDEYETEWVHGPYEKKAVTFLKNHCDLNIENAVELPSVCLKHSNISIPMDLTSISNFITDHKENINTTGYDLITTNSDPLYFNQGDPVVYGTKMLPDVNPTNDYVIVHASSISAWKNMEILNTLHLGVDIYGVGTVGEQIPPGAIDMRGIMLSEIAALMKKSKCVIGIHSSMACLAFHLGAPLIACHFWGGAGGQIKFSDYRENCIDLLHPTKENIVENLAKFGVQ